MLGLVYPDLLRQSRLLRQLKAEIDLAVSTIAIGLLNDTIYTKKVYGSDVYLEVMRRLSLESSKHLA
jgi:hypothetical protein